MKTIVAVTVVLVVGLATIVQRPASMAQTAPTDGAATYKTRCATCHGADGSGGPAGKAMKLRDLRSADVQKQTDDELFSWIAKGRGTMPGFENSLGADSCRALVAYVRTMAKK